MADFVADPDSDHESSLPPTKKSPRNCYFDSKLIQEFQGVEESSKGNFNYSGPSIIRKARD